jgi:hypothetical protein
LPIPAANVIVLKNLESQLKEGGNNKLALKNTLLLQFSLKKLSDQVSFQLQNLLSPACAVLLENVSLTHASEGMKFTLKHDSPSISNSHG